MVFWWRVHSKSTMVIYGATITLLVVIIIVNDHDGKADDDDEAVNDISSLHDG